MHSFKYKGQNYHLTDKWLTPYEDYSQGLYNMKDFQFEQYEYLIEIQDFLTLDNRLYRALQEQLIEIR